MSPTQLAFREPQVGVSRTGQKGQKKKSKFNFYLCGFLPVVVNLRVSGLRIWVPIIHIIAGNWVLLKREVHC